MFAPYYWNQYWSQIPYPQAYGQMGPYGQGHYGYNHNYNYPITPQTYFGQPQYYPNQTFMSPIQTQYSTQYPNQIPSAFNFSNFHPFIR